MKSTSMNTTSRSGRSRFAAAITLALVPAAAALASAGGGQAVASNGVGVCMSQVAIQPDLVGVDHLGSGIREIANAGAAGSGVPAALAGERDACGEPPGPGHLG